MTANSDLLCPRCNVPLEEVRTSHGVFWACENCAGRALTVELLRRTFTPESINPLWLHAISGEGKSGRLCPWCRNPMLEVALSGSAQVAVDVCQHCHFVWFDAHEMDTLAPRQSGVGIRAAAKGARINRHRKSKTDRRRSARHRF